MYKRQTLGNISDITKVSYISQAGTTFPKDTILQSNPSYLWHSQAKFIAVSYTHLDVYKRQVLER